MATPLFFLYNPPPYAVCKYRQMFNIILRHQDFIVIDKPSGISVHRDGEAAGLIALLAAQTGRKRLWLVHRLDKATSGVLLLACNPNAAAELCAVFAERRAEKTYWALSDRKPSKKQGRIKGGMEKARRGAWKLTRSGEHPAVTDFTSRSLAPGLRLFELRPQTGRTHQLRVAMKSLGSPADRLFLHARSLVFPYQGQTYRAAAPPDAAWTALMPSADSATFRPDSVEPGNNARYTTDCGKSA